MGAPDFFFGINATFRHILDTYGEEALHKYWQEMGREHYAFVTQAIRQRGLPALMDHWETLFPQEPGTEVEMVLEGNLLVLDVKICPAILHLKENGREITPCYCDHCTHVSRGMCSPVGIEVQVEGGMGACVQRFIKH